MDDSIDVEDPPRPRELVTAPCGLRTCGMHPEHLYTDNAGRAVRCPGDQAS